MISFLIPTCNFDCSTLVKTIWRQADALHKKTNNSFRFEIIVSDDASDNTNILASLENKTAGLSYVSILRQDKRLGRAANRNALISASTMPWKVFMDADAEVYSTNFVERYWEARNLADVVCGSLLPAEPQKGCELRYKYEKNASKNFSVEKRNNHPHTRFTVFNVMMNEKTTEKVRFDENCKDYGHEDTLFGMMLRDSGLTVVHIDNPLIHTGIDSNEEFLSKTEEALKSLICLPQLTNVVGSSRIYSLFERIYLAGMLRISSRAFCPMLRKNLLGRHPNLFLFDCYKLLFYSYLKNGGEQAMSK